MSREEHEMDLDDLKSCEGWLRALAWRILGNSDDVDDVVQDVWLASFVEPRSQPPSRAWLGAVTRNLSISRRRRRSQRLEVERRAAREEELGENVQSAIEKVSLYRRVLQWILEMEVPYRETLLLRFARDLGNKEVARLMGVPESTVRIRLKRGLVILRQKARAEFDEDRRRHLMLVLAAPGLRPQLGWKASLLALVSVAAAVLIALQLGSGSAEEPPTLAGSPAPLDADLASLPQRSPSAFDAEPGEIASAPEVRERGGEFLEGRLEFLLGDELHDCELDIAAVPYMVGRSMDLPGLRPPLPDWSAPYTAQAHTRVENGRPFRIAVPEAGRYRLMIAIEGVRGLLQFWSGTEHWTNADQAPPSRFQLLDGVEIIQASPTRGKLDLVWRDAAGPVEERCEVRGGRARVDGLYMPRLRLQWTDDRNGQVWVREINDRETVLKLPELGEELDFEIRSAEGAARLDHPRLEVLYHPQDGHPWVSGLDVVDPLRPRLRLPASASALGLQLRVSAVGRLARSFELTQGRMVDEVALERLETIRGRVLGLPESVLEAEAEIVARHGTEALFRGVLAADGSCELEPLPDVEVSGRNLEGRTLSFIILVGGKFLGSGEAVLRHGRFVVELPAARRFRIRARDVDGERLPGARAVVLPWDERPISQLLLGRRLRFDEAGVIEIDALRGGCWLLDIQAEGMSSRAFVLDAGDDSSSEFDIQLEPSREISCEVRVLDPENRPLGYVSLHLDPNSGRTQKELRSDGQGRIRLEMGEDETLGFEASYPGLTLSLSSPAVLAPGPKALELHMIALVDLQLDVEAASDEDEIWILRTSVGGEGRPRVQRWRPGKPVAIGAEKQVITVLQRGRRARSIPVSDWSMPARVSLPIGSRLVVQDGWPGDRVRLTPIALPGGQALPTELAKRLACEEVLEGHELVLEEMMPGRWEIELVREGQEGIRRGTFDLDADRVISAASLDL